MKIILAKVLIGVLAATAISGCVNVPQPAPRTAQFIESEYEPYDSPGTSVISGQAFLKTRGGDVKYGAGNIVSINPVTSYSTEWYEIVCIKQQHLSSYDPRVAKYLRQTVGDGSGNFRFSNLPEGEYYLMCEIAWEVPTQYGLARSGGVAHARVKVAAGEEVKAILTR